MMPGSVTEVRRPGRVAVIVNRAIDRWLILLLPLGIFIAISIRPIWRLRVDAPAEFLQPDPAWNARRRAQEEELARGYWKSAVGTIQWEYGFGSNLPAGPPQDFRIEESSPQMAGLEQDQATRARYWAKFRQVWLLPQTWERSYGWDTSWVGKSVTAARDWFMEYWDRIFYRP